jgi:hypothetical protein
VTEVIHQSFASGWVYGLVPPKTVEAESRCSNGVSKVETQHSFVNELVAFLTLGIYHSDGDQGHLRHGRKDLSPQARRLSYAPLDTIGSLRSGSALRSNSPLLLIVPLGRLCLPPGQEPRQARSGEPQSNFGSP